MLEKVAFKNFLALRDVEVDLEPFTVIVGPNACGKSTLLEGIHRICKLKSGNMDRLVQGGDFIPGYSNPKFSVDQIQSSGSKGTVIFDAKFSQSQLPNVNLSLTETRNHWLLSPNNHLPISGNIGVGPFSYFPDSNFFRLNGSRTARASYSPKEQPYLEADGSGLATVCSYLQSETLDSFDTIQKSLRSVIPTIKQFRIKREKVSRINWINAEPPAFSEMNMPELVIGQKLIFDFENASDVPADFVSEGTLISLALLAATAGATDNHIVLLDDIERGLHPRAIKDLIAQLRALQQLNPGLQIVATTHSPYVLDYLEGHEIRVATHDPERGMLIAPLNKHPDFERWSEAMDPGQFWSHVGESWVAELQEKTAADD